MISDTLFGAISIDDELNLFGQALILGSVALVAAMLYAAVRSMRRAYLEQGRRFSRCRLTGREATRRLLEHVGLPADRVDDGAKIDHYDVWRNRVRLRTQSSVSASVAALAIAAHEVGHADQFAKGYWAAHATRGLLVLLLLSAVLLFVYPFVPFIAGTSDVHLTHLIALLAIFPLLRLPVNLALERDATTRAKRLLSETRLADATEEAGIAQVLRAGFLTHLAFGVGLIVLIGACVATMWLVETGLDAHALNRMQVAVPNGFDSSGRLLPTDAIQIDSPFADYAYPVTALAVALATVCWAFSGRMRKAPVRTAVDANNDGMARFHAGDSIGAVALIEEALRLDPGLASAHYNRAVLLTSLGRNVEALASIEAMFTCRVEDVEPYLAIADPWYIRGTLRLDRGDYQGAIDDLSRAYDLDPAEPATLLCNRGLAWIRLGQLDRALQDTDQALSLSPDNAIAYNNRGVIYRDLGNLEQAEHDLRQAIAIDPQLPNPREHLAKLLAR